MMIREDLPIGHTPRHGAASARCVHIVDVSVCGGTTCEIAVYDRTIWLTGLPAVSMRPSGRHQTIIVWSR
jgi:hypothetical protein